MDIIKDDEIYFAKIRPTAVVPTKKDEDAGYDMYADFEGDYFVVMPYETKATPTGIATAFSKKYYAQIEERSSMAKLGIKKSAGVVDSGYRGEYFIMLYNTNSRPFVISKRPLDEVEDEIKIGEKIFKKSEIILYPKTKAICQIIMQLIPELETKEISYDELLQIKSQRSTGGFGSSGK